jgi:hypothetical protein
LASTIAVIFTGLLFRHERNVRREERADAATAQARLVVGRVVDHELPGTSIVNDAGDLDGLITHFVFEVKNYSGAPIYTVDVQVRPRTLDDSEVLEVVKQDDGPDLIEGSYRNTVEVAPLSWPLNSPFDYGRLQVDLSFVDANGLWWQRFGQDPPTRMPDHDELCGIWWKWLLSPAVAIALGLVGILLGAIAVLTDL